MSFGEKLQKMRKEKGLSQEALAELLGVSRQSVSKWESNLTFPETATLISISEIFGVTIDSLLKVGEVEKDRNPLSDLYWRERGSVYEYKSTKTLFGLPLVHIHVGRVAEGVKTFVDRAPRGQEFSLIEVETVKEAILSEYPGTWNGVLRWVEGFLRHY